MESQSLSSPGVTLALAFAAGIVAQSLARHLRIPGLLLLLAAGVMLGPDLADLVRPQTLGAALPILVNFAVAVILFEGGMNLNLRRLRREQRAIRQLVTTGAVITAVGGAATARLVLGWEWSLSILFGTLVIVTGPTVVQPLLRRLKVERSVATVLEAEGVLIDAVGAILAVVALGVVLSPTRESLTHGVLDVVTRLGFGVLTGLGGGALLALLLRRRNLVPEGLENVFTLSLVLALFQISSAFVEESGIAAVTLAGLVVGNVHTHVHRDLLEFKEQLTVMLIGVLFVLLAADVRLREVAALGSRGLVAVAVLMLVVRPLDVFVGTLGSGLKTRQKIFVGWIGPRGIVAAAVASLFANELARHGLPGGAELRALVFLVIAVTVLWAGVTGGLAARLLGVKRKTNRGWVILGAHELARELARLLQIPEGDVLCIDTNPQACQLAQAEGIKVFYGNALEERTLQRAEIDTRAGAIGCSPNDEVNLLFAQSARREARELRLFVAVGRSTEETNTTMVQQSGAHVLFGRGRDIDVWCVRLRRATARLQRWRAGAEVEPEWLPSADVACLPLAIWKDEKPWPVSEATELDEGDEIDVLVYEEQAATVHEDLTRRGLLPVDPVLASPQEPPVER